MPKDAAVTHRKVMQIAPPLDEGAAATMLRSLAQVPQDIEVVLDFHRVEPLEDVVVWRVVRAVLHSHAGPVISVGLTSHHQRLLRYLGLSTAEQTVTPPDYAVGMS